LTRKLSFFHVMVPTKKWISRSRLVVVSVILPF
jgi:hypothetical protein